MKYKYFIHHFLKTPIIMVGKWIPSCLRNRCEIKYDRMYDVFHHGRNIVMIN